MNSLFFIALINVLTVGISVLTGMEYTTVAAAAGLNLASIAFSIAVINAALISQARGSSVREKE